MTFGKPVSAMILGAGNRGMGYAAYAQAHPDRLRIVGVAEPRPYNRDFMAKSYQLLPENVAEDWRDLATRPRFADAVIIATQDAMHVEPAVAFARRGYAILLEKPMAPDLAGCEAIVQAVKENGNLFAVCHVMRYTAYTQAVRQVVESGVLGDIVSIQHLEPVGFWHQAHSFVRGNWRNQAESTFMLLAKSCHDLDWIQYILGKPCRSISSFGSLRHFRRSEKPAQAGDVLRCLDCAHEPNCPYSAPRIYLGFLAAGNTGWPVRVLTPDPTIASVTGALRTGPYGRCVYECDNDVVDNQVVNMQFEGGETAVFTMTAFSEAAHRQTRLFGTHGMLSGDGLTIQHFDFLSGETHTRAAPALDSSILGGHGGGDYGLMDRFVAAVAQDNPHLILSGADESLESHRLVFAAEQARLENRVVNL
ncbi:MAG TPA: Gfo/Idh/MocA family oxidoreductase [Levilinea sp.]|nr:Gfo/Idh/MocA family oxidoreductase [Levilinea sp.]